MAILQVKNLKKKYDSVEAVRGISFEIQEGSCFGLLGPNGAGKTTTIEILEGIAEASSGEVLFRNMPIGKHFKEKVGIQFQLTALQDFLTVREVLHLFQSFYPKSADVDYLIKMCALEEFLGRDNRKLSGGQRQRMLLAIALINDPDLVFLDEPTTGLDPQARRNFWELIRGVKSKGKTVVMTTHYMEEAYELCDEIAIMDKGLLIAQGAPNKLLKQHFNWVAIELPNEDFVSGKNSENIKHNLVGDKVVIETQNVNETIASLIASQVSLTHLKVRPQTLDDLFLKLTGNQIRN